MGCFLIGRAKNMPTTTPRFDAKLYPVMKLKILSSGN